MIEFNISAPGNVYCAAFTSGYVPISVVEILLNGGATASFENVGNMTITSLNAGSSYDIYCYTDDFGSQVMPFNLALATITTVETLCCRQLIVQQSHRFIYQQFQGSTIPDAQFAIALSAKPEGIVELNISIFSMPCSEYPLTSLQSIQSNVIALPRQFFFSPASSTLQASFIVRSAVRGCFWLSAVATGLTKSDYYTPVNITFSVEGNHVPPDPPALKEAFFSSDGTALYFTFDAATDKGASSLGNLSLQLFNCSLLLEYPGSSASICGWKSNTVLSALIARKSIFPNIGDAVMLLPQTLQALCIEGTFCSAYKKNVASTVSISPPLNPISPVVFISGPSFVSYCDDLYLDASSSTGSGGRPWSFIEWSVTSNDLSILTSNLESIRDTISTQDIGGKIIVPKTLLIPFGIYNISLRLVNFLQQSSVSRIQVAVLGSEIPIPRVSVYTSNLISFRWKEIVFFADASYASCAAQAKPLIYEWYVYSGHNYLPNILSASKDPRYLNIAPYSLLPNSYYTVMAVVSWYSSNNVNVVKSNATALLFIGSAGITAAISGGNSRVTGIDNAVTFDASSSYDIDYPTAALSFTWYCININPNYGGPCLATASGQFVDSKASLLTISSGSLDIGSYNITVEVYSSVSRESSNASVFLEVVGNKIPALYINPIQSTYNPSDKIILTGYISMINDNASAVWIGEGAVMPFINTTALERSFQISRTGERQTRVFQLALSSLPSVFPSIYATAGQSYTFRLLAAYSSTPSLFSSASVTIVVNSPPSNGILSANPRTGFVLSTLFHVTTSGWVDDPSDIPLRYLFSSYDLSPRSSLVIRALAELSFANTYLGQGLQSNHFIVTLVVSAYDIFNSNSNASASVSVMPLSGVDVTGPAFTAISSAFSNYDTSAVAAVIGASLSSVNSVDCSVPIDCGNLNRYQCKRTARTCGTCLPGYLGIDGDANIACQLPGNLNRTGELCSHNSTCVSGLCLNRRCHDVGKPCPGNCGAGGPQACTYLDQNGFVLSKCSVNDPQCVAVCQCPHGSYGRDCSLSRGGYISLLSFREYLCSTQAAVVLKSDATLNSFVSTTALIAEIFADQTQINQPALFNCTNALATSIGNIPEADFTTLCTGNAASTVLSSLSAIVSSGLVSNYPQLLQSISQLVDTVSNACLLTTALGEPANIIFSANINLLSMVAESAPSLTISVPQSEIYQFVGSSSSALTIISAAERSSSNGIKTISVSQFNNNPGKALTNSTAVRLQVDSLSSSGDINSRHRLSSSGSNFNVSIALKNKADVIYGNLSATTVIIKCLSLSKISYKKPYHCHNSSLILNATCPANARGLLTVTCPGYRQLPQCLVWNGTDFSSTIYCSVTGFNSTYTTCECSSQSFAFSSSSSVQQQFSSREEVELITAADSFQRYSVQSEVLHDTVITSSLYGIIAVFIFLLLCHFAWDRHFFVRSKVEIQGLKYKSEFVNRSVSIANFFESIFPDDEFVEEPWLVKYGRLLVTKNCWFRGVAVTYSRLPTAFSVRKRDKIVFQHAPVIRSSDRRIGLLLVQNYWLAWSSAARYFMCWLLMMVHANRL